jgi:hypothetical protein
MNFCPKKIGEILDIYICKFLFFIFLVKKIETKIYTYMLWKELIRIFYKIIRKLGEKKTPLHPSM